MSLAERYLIVVRGAFFLAAIPAGGWLVLTKDVRSTLLVWLRIASAVVALGFLYGEGAALIQWVAA